MNIESVESMYKILKANGCDIENADKVANKILKVRLAEEQYKREKKELTELIIETTGKDYIVLGEMHG